MLADLISQQLHSQQPQGIAVGLSGGVDSWTLALLARDYAAARNIPFVALTVDHRLRADSTAEAAAVHAACTLRGIMQHTLVWQHDGVASRKQERARAARYSLMRDWCAANRFTHLLTAHHADDQAETVLLRLAKGSGLAGLAGITPMRALNDGVILLRPFLSVPKADLISYAMQAGVPVMQDSSNDNPAFARVRLRQAQDVLAREGLTRDNLIKLTTTAREERDALDYAATTLLLANRKETQNGFTGGLMFDAAPWEAAPPALRRAAFIAVWRQLTGEQTYQPRREEIDALCQALTADGTKRTLGGLICSNRKGQLVFIPENLSAKTAGKS